VEDFKINYNNINANEVSNSLSQVENKLKKSSWSYLCIQHEGDVINITVVGLWTKLGQVIGSWFGKEDKTLKKSIDNAFSEILRHNKDLIDKEQLDKVQSIAHHAHLITISLDKKENQTIEAVAKDINKVADFLKEKKIVLENPPLLVKTFTALPIQKIQEKIEIQVKEYIAPENKDTMPTTTSDPLSNLIVEKKALSAELFENFSDASEIEKDFQEYLTQEEKLNSAVKNPMMTGNNFIEENSILQKKPPEIKQQKLRITLKPDLIAEKESSCKNFLLTGVAIGVTTLVAHYFNYYFLQDQFWASTDLFNKTPESITSSLSHTTQLTGWHKNHIFVPIKGTSTSIKEGLSDDEWQTLQSRTINTNTTTSVKARIEAAILAKDIGSIKELFFDLFMIAEINPKMVENVLLKMLESYELEILKYPTFQSLFSKDEKNYLEVAEQLFRQGKGKAIVEKAFGLWIKLDKNLENIFFLQQLLQTANDYKLLSIIAETNSQLVENVLLKALESDDLQILKFPNLKSIFKDEKTYLEVTERLFSNGKGEAIIEKAFDLCLKLNENSENLFFLQQLLKTSMDFELLEEYKWEILQNEIKINTRFKQINEAKERIEAATHTEGMDSIRELFPDLFIIAETNSQLVENVLLKALESDKWKAFNLLNLKNTLSKDEETYIELANHLFYKGKGQPIVDKAFAISLKMSKNSKEKNFFLQQLLLTAIDNHLL
jgi:hypothetical protein